MSPEGTKNGNVYTYNKDTVVTVTVTPDVLKVLDSFKVDGAEKTLTADNTYSLTVTANTTIAATFKYQAASTNALILDEAYYGTYICYSDDQPDPDVPSIVVCPIGVFWGENEIEKIEKWDGGEEHYGVRVNGADDWEITITEDDISLIKSFYIEQYYFRPENAGPITYTVELPEDDTMGTVTISPEKDAYESGEEVTITVTANSGYVVVSVQVEGEIVSLDEQNSYTFTIRHDTYIYVDYALTSIPTEWGFIGEWKNIADSSETFTVAADKVTWKNQNYPLVNAKEQSTSYEINFDIDGAESITYNAEANAFQLVVATGEGKTTYVFVKGNGDVITDDFYYAEGTYSGLDNQETLVLSKDGKMTLNSTDVAAYSDGERYWIFHNSKLYSFDFMWGDKSYFVLTAADDSGDLRYTASEVGEIPADLVGTWTGEKNATFAVAENGTITWNNSEGYTLRLIGVTCEGGVSVTVVITKGEKSIIDRFSISSVYNDDPPYQLIPDKLKIEINVGKFFNTDEGGGFDPAAEVGPESPDAGDAETDAEPVTIYVFTKTLTKLSTPTGLTNGTYTAEGGTFNSIVVSADGIKAMASDFDPETFEPVLAEKDVYVAATGTDSYIVYINGSRYTLSVSDGNIVLDNGYDPQTYSLGTPAETTPQEPAPTEPAV